MEKYTKSRFITCLRSFDYPNLFWCYPGRFHNQTKYLLALRWNFTESMVMNPKWMEQTSAVELLFFTLIVDRMESNPYLKGSDPKKVILRYIFFQEFPLHVI